MFKKVLFQLHWFFGISAGLILALMGITGAMYSFEPEIIELLNPSAVMVDTGNQQRLSPNELVLKAQAESGKTVSGLFYQEQGTKPTRLFFTPPPGQRRGESRIVNPYTGEQLAPLRGEGFLGFVLQLHRFLAAGEVGKQLTAASTLALVFFCLSGLYLRWPRQAASWRAWLTLDWARKGRSFNWDLHAVAGTWCLLVYLLASITGLYWSYDWVRDGLTRMLGDEHAGQQRKKGRGRPGAEPQGPAPVVDYDRVWASIRQTGGEQVQAWSLRLPPVAGQPAQVFYVLSDAEHPRAFNLMELNPETGKVARDDRYSDKSTSAQLLASVYPLHTGEYFGLVGRIIVMVASLLMPLFAITGWLLYLDRRRKKRATRIAQQGVIKGAATGESWLVGFASQSGFAEQLAWQTAGQLQAAGIDTNVQPLAKINQHVLSKAHNALFVISTFGDGEAPDSARGFESSMLASTLSLGDMRYAVLALGDRQYQQFCGFAQRVHQWLAGQGAHSLFAPVEVDAGDVHAINHWQQQLSAVTGADAVLTTEEPFVNWRLHERECLNPGSAGLPMYLLGLQPPAGAQWQAGDILQVRPANDPTQKPREYSIASLPSDGVLELLVRQERHPDGSHGLCSGWLTEAGQPMLDLQARLRSNSAFHPPEDDRPVILIGNGSGLAGLRCILKARVKQGHRRNWLLFGERNRTHDFYCEQELLEWQSQEYLTQLDPVFSRDQADKLYVQDQLRASEPKLRQWLEQGAAIYVCGSLQGMAAGVDKVLREVIGEEAVNHLQESGRYRRDVY
ncbi:sulfite reductase flavoprotein subunit alpha [Pseudomonas sp. EL_65y_Pfl2_R95]|uniref:sulfite reductase flavoprotein subunit alpha n=1 Tax=Pseudomonas sp. EL_65y_Pfl2_R95 TaxID=3088698 RepID=UPI0030D829C0